MNIIIDHLCHQPSHAAAVAELIYAEYWRGVSGYSPAHFARRLREANDPDRIPLCLVAIAGGATVGTVNLVDNDDARRPHLHPWLAALVVVPGARGRGVGTRLVRALLDEAWRLRFATLYFGTTGAGFYRRLGARPHEQVTADFCIMRFDLGATGAPARP
jgi:predicted N-acetyltransferase YhbS